MTTLRPHLVTRRPIIVPHVPAQPAKPDDGALADSVRLSLRSTGYQQPLRIDVAVKDGHVKLSGRLRRYYLRQIAQQAAMTTDGVTTLESQIEIDR